ncbi:hypothetical protein [Neisseria bacilliformis]|uniref:hypothetical protein n=2 Tax=Neisseria bacilliformis TaxID=267212 RepID=UPI000302FB2A|nr:hypothetical protein [Neisseria bacilliformis]
MGQDPPYMPRAQRPSENQTAAPVRQTVFQTASNTRRGRLKAQLRRSQHHKTKPKQQTRNTP